MTWRAICGGRYLQRQALEGVGPRGVLEEVGEDGVGVPREVEALPHLRALRQLVEQALDLVLGAGAQVEIESKT